MVIRRVTARPSRACWLGADWQVHFDPDATKVTVTNHNAATVEQSLLLNKGQAEA